MHFFHTAFILLILALFCSCTPSRSRAEQSSSNGDKTDSFDEYIKSRQMTPEQLKKMAEEKGIPYRKVDNGITYELQGFDEVTGQPLYYIAGPVQKSHQLSPK